MVRNLSITGGQLALPARGAAGTEIATGSQGELLMDHSIVPPLRAVVHSSLRDGPTQTIGVQFLPGQDRARALLALTLFRSGGIEPDAVALDAGPERERYDLSAFPWLQARARPQN